MRLMKILPFAALLHSPSEERESLAQDIFEIGRLHHLRGERGLAARQYERLLHLDPDLARELGEILYPSFF